MLLVVVLVGAAFLVVGTAAVVLVSLAAAEMLILVGFDVPHGHSLAVE